MEIKTRRLNSGERIMEYPKGTHRITSSRGIHFPIESSCPLIIDFDVFIISANLSYVYVL